MLHREASNLKLRRLREDFLREVHVVRAGVGGLDVARAVDADAVEPVIVRLAVGDALVDDRRVIVATLVGRAGGDRGADLLDRVLIDVDENLEVGQAAAALIAARDVQGDRGRTGIDRTGIRRRSCR